MIKTGLCSHGAQSEVNVIKVALPGVQYGESVGPWERQVKCNGSSKAGEDTSAWEDRGRGRMVHRLSLERCLEMVYEGFQGERLDGQISRWATGQYG